MALNIYTVYKSLGEAPTSVVAAWSHSLRTMSLNILHIYIYTHIHTHKIYVYIEVNLNIHREREFFKPLAALRSARLAPSPQTRRAGS